MLAFAANWSQSAIRYRLVTLRFDGIDDYGSAFWRCDFLENPPSQTFYDELDRCGFDVTEPTPNDVIEDNHRQAKADRKVTQDVGLCV